MFSGGRGWFAAVIQSGMSIRTNDMGQKRAAKTAEVKTSDCQYKIDVALRDQQQNPRAPEDLVSRRVKSCLSIPADQLCNR